MIPLVNLQRQYFSIKKEINKGLLDVLRNGSFILGKEVEKFEKEFASFTGAKYCVGVANGRDAILLSLVALGVANGDEIITVPNTYISTVFPIIELGAKPTFVDINPATYQMDLTKLESAITKRTKAIIPVHLFGYPNDMEKIMAIARKHKLKILEDACQAHGVRFEKKHVGTFGDLGAFSFYPGKNLGAFGDAGAVITNDKKLYNKIRMLRDVGQSKKYFHDVFGYNSRLDTIQAAVLSVKLKKLESWNEKRRKIAGLYFKHLPDLSIILPPKPLKNSLCNYHLFVIRTNKRDALLEYLKKKDIYCGIHYPIPVHFQKSMKHLGYKIGDFPIAEKYANEILSIPIFSEMTTEEVKEVVDSIKKFYRRG